MHRRLKVVPDPCAGDQPPPGGTDRRPSHRLLGLGVNAQVELAGGLGQLFVALDRADTGHPQADDAIADARLLLAQAITDIRRVLVELNDPDARHPLES